MAVVRWRSILANWINCYDEDTDLQLQPSTLDRILHKLQPGSDDPKLDDFIFDKYPEFKFENGTPQPSTEDDMVMAASLLLLHMCVYSKDVEMKNLMCRKLVREDQEIILKFTKCLMNSTPITYDDVRTALIECSGADFPSLSDSSGTATSTPPPLRALHGEVRRLKAALDAERFDRAYLQDELAATNSKLEKLLKDKEHCKKEISSLKAQLVIHETELNTSGHSTPKRTNARRKYARQLSAMEERLVDTQATLEECERVRDIYKNKMEELKRDRDKWVALGQSESERACSLAEQLDAEQRASGSLREMLSELRAHNKANRADDSMLECDDDSPRRRSFAHDSSVSGDVCTSVIEVQLCEERARITSLAQELQSYHEKVKTLEKALLEKDDEIEIKNNQIKDEVLQKNNMIVSFNKEQSEMQKNIDENRILIQSITSQMEQLKTEKESVEMKAFEYEKVIETNKSYIEEIEKKNAEVNDKYEETSRIMTGLIEDLKAEKKYLENKAANTQLIITSNKVQINELTSENASYKDTVQSMSAVIEGMKCENDILEKELAQLSNVNKSNYLIIEELRNENSLIKMNSLERIKSITTQLEQSEVKKEEIARKINEYKDAINVNALQLSEIKNENLQLKKTIQQKNDEIGNVKREKENVQIQANDLKSIILSVESQVTLLLNKNIEKGQEAGECFISVNLEIDDNLDAVRETLIIKMIEFENMLKFQQSKIAQVQEENNILKVKAVETLESHNAIIDELNKEKLILEIKIHELDSLLNSIQTEVVKLKQENTQFLNENILLEAKAVETSQSHNAILEKFTEERESLQIRIHDYINMSKIFQEEIEMLQRENAQLHHNIAQLEAKTVEMTQTHSTVVNKFLTEREDLEIKFVEYEKMFKTNQDELAKLEQDITQARNKNAKLECEWMQAVKSSESNSIMIEKISEDRKNLEEKLTEYEILCTVNQDEIARLRQQSEQFKNENTQLNTIASETIQSQEAVIQNLSTEKEALKVKIAEHEKINTANQVEMSKMHEESVNNKKVSDDTLNAMSQQFEKLKEKMSVLEEMVNDYKKIISDNQSQIDLAEKEKVNLKKVHEETIKKMTDELNKAENENQSYEKKLIEYENMILNDQCQIAEIQNENEKVTKTLHGIIQNLTAEKKNLEENFVQSQIIIATKESVIEQLKNDNVKIKEKTEEIITLTNKIGELNTTKEALESETDYLKTIIESNKIEMCDLKNRHATLVNQVDEGSKFMEDYMEKVSSLENKLIVIAENMDNCKSEMKCIKNELEEDNMHNNVKSENQVLWNKSHIEEIMRRVDKIMKKIVYKFDMLSSENTALENKLIESNTIIESYKSEIQCLQGELGDVTFNLQKIKEENETVSKKNNEYALNIVQLQSDNEELKNKTDDISAELSNGVIELTTTKTILNQKSQQLNDMITQLQNECEQVKSKSKDNIELMRDKINKVRVEEDTFENESVQSAEIINSIKSKIEQLENEKVKYKEKAEEIAKSTSVEISELKFDKRLLEEKISEHKNTISNIQLEIKHLQNENAQQKCKIEEITKLYDQANKDNVALIKEHEMSNKTANELMESLQYKKCELEKKILEQCEETTKLLEENRALALSLDKSKEELLSVRQNLKNIISSENYIDVIPAIDVTNLNEGKLEELLNDYVNSLISLHKNVKMEKNILETYVSELKSQIRDITEELYSVKLKLKIIISQNNGYLDSMTKDTDLFEKKYGFVNVTQESCVVPDANESFEQFLGAVENILMRNKTIANVFKTEFKSLTDVHKLALNEKETVAGNIESIRSDYEKRLTNLNEQLTDKKALVNHLEKDIEVMENDKNAIINNLKEQLEKTINKLKVFEENNIEIEMLKCKLEESNKVSEEYKTKENYTEKHFTQKIEALQIELSEKKKIIEDKLEIERHISACRSDIADILSELNLTLIDLGSVNVDFLNGSAKQTRNESIEATTWEVRPLCDEEKMKSISSEEHEFWKLKSELQMLIKTASIAINLIKNTKSKLKVEIDKNSQLETILIAKTTLVESLEQEVANVELKLDSANSELKEIKEQRLEQHTYTETKLAKTDAMIAEKEELVQDLNNNIVKLTTERDNLKETLNTKVEIMRDTITQLNMLIDIFESNNNEKFDDIIQNIEKLFRNFSDSESKLKTPLHLRLNNLSLTIAELRDRNDVLNVKCEQMELEKNSRIKTLAREVAALSESIAHREDMVNNVKESKEKDVAELQMQVQLLSSDLVGTSEERNQTISNLEKIVYDKNRIITTLQGDITYLKNLVAESEYKLLDVTKELEQCRDNCSQLSVQLKKTVNLKNEEISCLKKQLSKISSYESDASQIIKVSAKYQAIILKRIAEIKSNPVLRELTQFNNVESDKRKSLVGGAVTISELENFLEGTERHLRKLTEKQTALQKERDRMEEISKINESETISLKKYLTELLAHFKTFTSVKDMYNQKLSQVISKQRMIRREIHSLENIPDTVMSKLERSYGIVMQDLCETALNLGRWAEKCIDRSISPEKLKQAFACDAPTLSTSHFQNTGLEVQIEELMTAFKRVHEEVQKAKNCEPSRGNEACNVMEVRAEYEDKLNRMKAKMKQLYHEQMSAYQNKQDAELDKLRRKLEDKSKAYEEHIQGLTRELWNVGEKFLMKKEEAEWLRRRNPSSSSLMSLQHVHSSGLGPPPREYRESREPRSRDDRPADTQSLHAYPAHKPKSENRGFHMSDEEGEVFDNRWLKELETPPPPERDRRRTTAVGAAGAAGGTGRISELKYRNSLCPPHLKSSYPAETHYAVASCNEDDIKFEGGAAGGEKRNRKEVGIIAYKKPGPPTPSKNAGRLSATDSELRESLRPEPEAPSLRKTTTPSRLRALFRSNRSDADNTGTPRSKRLSIFRKK